MSKSKTGRKPTSPLSLYRPEYCNALIAYAKTGPTATFNSFADKIGVCLDTIFEWANQHPEFKKAKQKAKRLQEKQMMDLGYKGMTGRIRNFQTGVWIFWMKARFSWNELGPADVEETELEFTE